MRADLLQWFFRLLYTRLAWAYDAVAWGVSAGAWYDWGEAAIGALEQGPVLELGCGRGRLLGALGATGMRVVGVDRSPQMARQARRASGCPVVLGDGRMLPFPDGAFGSVVTVFPAPYVLEPATQREIARVVRNGGRWIWVDDPRLDGGSATVLARLVSRVAAGTTRAPLAPPPLAEERSGGRWRVTLRRVPRRSATVLLRIAERI